MTHRLLPRDLSEMIDPAYTALLMWDFQVGLGGNATNLDLITETGNRILQYADEARVPVIWSRHTVPDLAQVTAGSLYRMMKKQGVQDPSAVQPFMQEGSSEREFLEQIRPRPHDTIIEKSTPSFFIGTPLNLRLAALGINSILLCGVATDIGVDLTAKHAFALGYFPVVVEDAVGSYSDERHRAALQSMKSWIPIADSRSVIEAWASRGPDD